MLFRKKSASNAQKIKNILIVEDEPLVAFDNELSLGEAGFKVVATVNTGADAKDVIDKGAVDLILADIQLAGDLTGVDVARHAAERGVHVLFSSGSWSGGPVDFALGWLAKPYNSDQLIDAVIVADQLARNAKPQRVPRGLRLFR
jgi:two-component system, response regulator PdtaR